MGQERTTKKLFAIRLSEGRHRAALTQKELGILAGIDESSASPRVNQYESGKHTPAFEIAVNLAKALKIPVAYFYTVEDDLAQLLLEFASLSSTQQSQVKRFIEALLK